MPDVRFTSKQQLNDYRLQNLVDEFGRSSHHVRAADQADGSSRVYTSSKWSLTSLKAALGWTEKLAARETKRKEGGNFVFHLVAKEVGEEKALEILGRFGDRFATGIRGRDLRDIQNAVNEEIAPWAKIAIQAGADLIKHFESTYAAGQPPTPADVRKTLEQLHKFLESTFQYEVDDPGLELAYTTEGSKEYELRGRIFANILNATLENMEADGLRKVLEAKRALEPAAEEVLKSDELAGAWMDADRVRLRRTGQVLSALERVVEIHLGPVAREPEPQAAPARPAESTGAGGAESVEQTAKAGPPAAQKAGAQPPTPADVAKALTAQLNKDLSAETDKFRKGTLESALRMLNENELYKDADVSKLIYKYEAQVRQKHPPTPTLFVEPIAVAELEQAEQARPGHALATLWERTQETLEKGDLLGQPFRMAIPIHTGNATNGHWTGAFVSFDPNAAAGTPKVKIQTVDSLSTASSLRTLNPALQATLKAVFGNDILGGGPVEIEAVMPKHRQDDSTSCGACTMENLLDLAMGPKETASRFSEINEAYEGIGKLFEPNESNETSGPSGPQPFAANDMMALRLHQVQTLLQAP